MPARGRRSFEGGRASCALPRVVVCCGSARARAGEGTATSRLLRLVVVECASGRACVEAEKEAACCGTNLGGNSQRVRSRRPAPRLPRRRRSSRDKTKNPTYTATIETHAARAAAAAACLACCACTLVTTSVEITSLTVHPRDRSLTGSIRFCKTGPIAIAPEDCCTLL